MQEGVAGTQEYFVPQSLVIKSTSSMLDSLEFTETLTNDSLASSAALGGGRRFWFPCNQLQSVD